MFTIFHHADFLVSHSKFPVCEGGFDTEYANPEKCFFTVMWSVDQYISNVNKLMRETSFTYLISHLFVMIMSTC